MDSSLFYYLFIIYSESVFAFSIVICFPSKSALMNTSFNIHGEPIVGTPEDAVDTFLRCGLHHLLIGSWLVSKK